MYPVAPLSLLQLTVTPFVDVPCEAVTPVGGGGAVIVTVPPDNVAAANVTVPPGEPWVPFDVQELAGLSGGIRQCVRAVVGDPC